MHDYQADYIRKELDRFLKGFSYSEAPKKEQPKKEQQQTPPKQKPAPLQARLQHFYELMEDCSKAEDIAIDDVIDYYKDLFDDVIYDDSKP
jgi:hypothetical protein